MSTPGPTDYLYSETLAFLWLLNHPCARPPRHRPFYILCICRNTILYHLYFTDVTVFGSFFIPSFEYGNLSTFSFYEYNLIPYSIFILACEGILRIRRTAVPAVAQQTIIGGVIRYFSETFPSHRFFRAKHISIRVRTDFFLHSRPRCCCHRKHHL